MLLIQQVKRKLCVEYKNLTKNKESRDHTGVYYNAYSEDLFMWDNDEEHDNANMRLKVSMSSLSQYHGFLDGSPSLLEQNLGRYNPKYLYTLNPHENPENGVESITFRLEEGGSPIKISRGEERIFIWCFFLSLFEVDEWAGEHDAHVFIDDPVSSLDDHNIFITADSIYDIIEKHYLKRRIIITTHHIGLYSILFDRLRKGEKSSRYRNLTKPFILTNLNNELDLKHHDKDVFLFHLHLMQVIDEAVKTKLYVYHFVLLRQLLENISSFLGSGNISYVLSEIEIEDPSEAANRINSMSHQNTYRFQFNEMSAEDVDFFKDVFKELQIEYSFIY
jgi:hypothetical protein